MKSEGTSNSAPSSRRSARDSRPPAGAAAGSSSSCGRRHRRSWSPSGSGPRRRCASSPACSRARRSRASRCSRSTARSRRRRRPGRRARACSPPSPPASGGCTRSGSGRGSHGRAHRASGSAAPRRWPPRARADQGRASSRQELRRDRGRPERPSHPDRPGRPPLVCLDHPLHARASELRGSACRLVREVRQLARGAASAWRLSRSGGSSEERAAIEHALELPAF